MLFQDEETSGRSYNSTFVGVKVGVSHQLFLSDRIFTNISVNNYGIDKDNQGIFPGARLTNITTYYFGVGYYFPQIANFANKWLSSWLD